MTRLAIGASISLPVDPHELFVPTGLEVAPGERYGFVASGMWLDWIRTCDATGWSSPLQRWNRVPKQPFFLLCGCIGSDDANAFAIGAGCDWPVPDAAAALTDRRLHLFANDWRCMYWNNQELPPDKGGPLSVGITRLA